NSVLTTQAFTPSIVVASDGKVGVTYYDLRKDNPSDNTQLLATAWLAVSSDGGKTFTESLAGGPFDLRNAARTREGYFIGDYQGLAASGTTFIPFFVMTNTGNDSNRSDVFARPPAAAVASFGAEFAAQALPARTPRTGARRIF